MIGPNVKYSIVQYHLTKQKKTKKNDTKESIFERIYQRIKEVKKQNLNAISEKRYSEMLIRCKGSNTSTSFQETNMCGQAKLDVQGGTL